MKKLIIIGLLVITASVGASSAVSAIGSYAWTDNCKCIQVGPNFAQYVPVSNCKGVPSTHGCK